MRSLTSHLDRALRTQVAPVTLLVALGVLANVALQSSFLESASVGNFFTSYAPLAFVAAAQAVVLLAGGIDLSVGGTVSLVNVTIARLGESRPDIAVPVGLAVGLAVGVVNAFAIGVLRVRPLMATFATGAIAVGIALWILPLPGGLAPTILVMTYASSPLGIPVPVLGIVTLLVAWLAIRRTPFALRMRAIGANAQKAYVSGVRVQQTIFGAYLLSAVLSSVAALALSANIASGDAGIGTVYTIDSIAAAVIGGTSLSGGVGTVVGAILGAIFLGLVANATFLANLSSNYQLLTSGVIVLGGIVAAGLFRRLRIRAT